MQFFLLIALYIVLNSSGQLLIKMGALQLTHNHAFFELIKNYKLITGIFLFGLSFLTWIVILTKNDLSYAFPFAVGLGYASVIVLSVLVLKEPVSLIQWSGILLVGIGIIIMSLQNI